MTIEYGKLVHNTEFKYMSKKWKKGSMCWRTNEYVTDKEYAKIEDIPLKDCTKAIPFLGGQYQTELEYWIPDDTKVEVN